MKYFNFFQNIEISNGKASTLKFLNSFFKIYNGKANTFKNFKKFFNFLNMEIEKASTSEFLIFFC